MACNECLNGVREWIIDLCPNANSIMDGYMGKRKREVFTVIESVPNWFEAHTSTVIKTVEGEGVVNHLGSGSCDISSTRGYLQSAGGVANEPNQFPPVHVAATTGTGSIPVVGHTRVGTDRLGVSPLAFDSADVAKPHVDEGREQPTIHIATGSVRYLDGELPQGMGGVQVEEDPTSAAFWQLLRDASYHVW